MPGGSIAAMPGDRSAFPDWLASLATRAPDLVAPLRALEAGRPLGLRREVRARAGVASVDRILPQHEAVAAAYAEHLDRLPDEAFGRSGGKGSWNVAQALGHAFDARAGMLTAASLAARGRFPADAPTVVPGVPGAADARRDDLRHRLAVSQRIVERGARSIAGHETDCCPLEHPLVGRLRCGEWFLFAGVHDLMHLEQLEALSRGLAADVPAGALGTRFETTRR